MLIATLITAGIAAGLFAGPYLPVNPAELAARLPDAGSMLKRIAGSNASQGIPVTPPPAHGKMTSARAMPICGRGYRLNCVVDGDTIWVDREKIRLETIDAPEVHGRCAYETDLAAKATRRLQSLLSGHNMTLDRSGHDIYGRTLARVSTDQGEVGGILAGEGLARRWTGHRMPWC